MFRVMAKVNGKCIDGKRSESIEKALFNFKQMVCDTDNIIISIAFQENNRWCTLSDQELESTKNLVEEIFGNAKLSKYAPSSIRLSKR